VTAEWAVRRGNPLHVGETLQWGRGHVTAECRHVMGNDPRQQRFNGAAVT